MCNPPAGESIDPISTSVPPQKSSERSPIAWADTPWTVAALLGVWGVFIGLEEYLWADLCIALAGAWCVIQLCRDCFGEGRRRVLYFILGTLLFGAIVAGDLRWTARRKNASEAKAQEIPGLKSQIGQLQDTIKKQNDAIIQQQSESNQRLRDISDENGALRKSVEVKDAALVSIAKQQYALNFFPQIVVTTNGSSDTLYIENHGKTNIDVYRLVLKEYEVADAMKLSTVAPTASTTYLIQDMLRTMIFKAAVFTKDRIGIEGAVFVVTLDKKKYTMPFTWFFEVKDGKIVKSYIIDGSITGVP